MRLETKYWPRPSKMGNVRTGGYDSKLEAQYGQELELRQKGKDIKDFDRQYRVEIQIYNSVGDLVHTVRHKVDFRIHHNDGTFELVEVKGFETTDYRFRRKLLEKLWLPEHPDHRYTVLKQGQIR